jgi:hypothetical protein
MVLIHFKTWENHNFNLVNLLGTNNMTFSNRKLQRIRIFHCIHAYSGISKIVNQFGYKLNMGPFYFVVFARPI